MHIVRIVNKPAGRLARVLSLDTTAVPRQYSANLPGRLAFGRVPRASSAHTLADRKLLGMSRPPVQTVMEFLGAVPWLTMRKTSARKSCSKHLGKAAGAFLLIAGLAILVGCQGVSAAGNQQLPTGLSLADSSLNFGSVVKGSSKTVSVNATNSGNASITVSSAAISSRYFTLVSPSLPMTVAAGQTTPITVKFTPNAAGAFTAAVTITSNDPSNPTTQLSL